MHPKPLHTTLAVLILLIAGGVLWYVLTRPVPETIVLPNTPAATEAKIEEEGAYYEIDASYPAATPLKVTTGASADAAAVALMKNFAQKEVARFKDVNEVTSISAEDAAMIPGLGTDRKYAFGMEYTSATTPISVSYVFLMYEDTLGAHPNAYYRTFTFDTRTGEAVHIDDLFVDDEYLEVLSQKSRAILVPQIAAAYEIPVAEFDRTMLDAGTTPFVDNFGNFYLQGDALVIVFPPYQIGPWALGAQEARIPKSELSAVLKAEYR